MISECFGFTPAEILKGMTLSQFLIYARYAKEQKNYELNIRNLDDYLQQILGGKQENNNPKKKRGLSIIDHKNNYNNRLNNDVLIREARDSLIKKTGRKSFLMTEISNELNILYPPAGYKTKLNKV